MTKKPISENVSEKPRRGRPQAPGYHGDIRRSMEAVGVYTDIATERGKQNRDNALTASGLLSAHPNPEAIRWLYDAPAHRAGTKKMRFGILTELGRIYRQNGDDQQIFDLATLLSNRQPKTRDAVTMLRRYRVRRQRPGSAIDLTKRIGGVIDAYLATHPGTTKQQVLAAMEGATDAVTETEWPEADE
jgi:hypothetical protein